MYFSFTFSCVWNLEKVQAKMFITSYYHEKGIVFFMAETEKENDAQQDSFLENLYLNCY